ncbi:MAG TPA: hypothetical protein EYN66_05805 [Myxococcales bacterium]|nr:hypothetical protein [Myxococcales bacterium]
MSRDFRTICALMVLAICLPLHSFAEIPNGFKLQLNSDGVELYSKSYNSGPSDFVLVVDLEWAQLRSVLGEPGTAGPGTEIGGEAKVTFTKKSLLNHWQTAKAKWPKTVAVINGQFFNNLLDPPTLNYPVKTAGEVVSGKAAATIELVADLRLLQVDNAAGEAQITSFDSATLYDENSGPEMVAGLDVKPKQGELGYAGRTFVGVQSGGKNASDRVLFFVSSYASQTSAASVLSNFGATQQLMMDGKHAQLIVNSTPLIYSTAAIPHAFAIVAEAVEVPGPPINDQDLDGFLSDVNDCNDQDAEIHPDAQEICDGIDNNCNEQMDEGFAVGTECTVGQGTCLGQGTIECVSANASECNAQFAAEPVSELCDFLDNDCDGVVDEDLNLGEYCEKTSGGCVTNGVWACHLESGDVVCTAPEPAAGRELCNGVDDDCDGLVDEGFQVGDACSEGEGACKVEGFLTCDSRGAAYCKAPQPDIQEERCDGLDNDCDGVVDEGFELGNTCEVELESCTVAGVTVCSATGLNMDCKALTNNCDDTTPIIDGGDGTQTGAGSSSGAGSGGRDPTILTLPGDESSGCIAAPRPLKGHALMLIFLTLLLMFRRQGQYS